MGNALKKQWWEGKEKGAPRRNFHTPQVQEYLPPNKITKCYLYRSKYSPFFFVQSHWNCWGDSDLKVHLKVSFIMRRARTHTQLLDKTKILSTWDSSLTAATLFNNKIQSSLGLTTQISFWDILNGFSLYQVKSCKYMYMHGPLIFSSMHVIRDTRLLRTRVKCSAPTKLDYWAFYEIIHYTSDLKENLYKHNIRESKYLVPSS